MNKKQIKRLMVLMFAAAFGLSIAGCTGEPTSSQSDPAASEVSVTDAADSEAPDEKSEQESTVSETVVTKQSQQLSTTGIINARELGGYPAADGKKIKSGVLLRTAKLSTATEEDISILKDNYHLGYIVDMRTISEIGEETDPEIEGAEYISTPIDITSFLNKLYAVTDQEERTSLLTEAYNDGQLGEFMYVNALKQDTVCQEYKVFFDTLLKGKGEKAVLWHCSYGKDRTGLGAALLLSVLGVDEDTIMNDYLLTNEFYAGAEDAAREKMSSAFPDNPELVDALAELSGGVKEKYLRNALDYMKQESGSAQAFVKDKIGVTDEEIGLLRTYYLE